MTPPNDTNRHWVVDKRIPVALILTVLMHFGIFVYAYAELSIGQRNHETRIVNLETDQSGLEKAVYTLNERMSRVEALLQAQLETSRRIEAKLDRNTHQE